ncbi:MAG: hypothetical protein ACREQF_08000 [Candidatus Binataceae bacterium]
MTDPSERQRKINLDLIPAEWWARDAILLRTLADAAKASDNFENFTRLIDTLATRFEKQADAIKFQDDA